MHLFLDLHNKSFRTHLGRTHNWHKTMDSLIYIFSWGNKYYSLYLMKLYILYVQVATAQIASTGMVALSYVQKVSEKVSVCSYHFLPTSFFALYEQLRHISICVQVSLASDFMYNHITKDVTASFGYDYMLRQVSLLV